jgi:hypothetical protein
MIRKAGKSQTSQNFLLLGLQGRQPLDCLPESSLLERDASLQAF